jgi:hypothetical protein
MPPGATASEPRLGCLQTDLDPRIRILAQTQLGVVPFPCLMRRPQRDQAIGRDFGRRDLDLPPSVRKQVGLAFSRPGPKGRATGPKGRVT